jgi:hypothetical protein
MRRSGAWGTQPRRKTRKRTQEGGLKPPLQMTEEPRRAGQVPPLQSETIHALRKREGFRVIMIMNNPALVFVVSLAVLYVSARVGAALRSPNLKVGEDERTDFGLVVGGTLTLLGLIIGFSFSMAIERYDQRKNYEEAEANAIGTEYVRADLLPAADGAKVRVLLKSYLDERVLFYRARDRSQLPQINARTSQLQNELWAAVQAPTAQPNAVFALAISGMNDVLNSQGYTQAAWWNRIPIAAWGLMFAIAICCCVLIGYGARGAERKTALFLVLPLLVAISFFLIADIDSPRGGIIRVKPQNLESLAHSLPGAESPVSDAE